MKKKQGRVQCALLEYGYDNAQGQAQKQEDEDKATLSLLTPEQQAEFVKKRQMQRDAETKQMSEMFVTFLIFYYSFYH